MTENLPEKTDGGLIAQNGGPIIEGVRMGATMIQTRTDFQTALQVQKPRDLDDITSNIMKEAKHAGDSWYYSWPVSTRDGRTIHIEGPSIGLMTALFREWGNCAIDIQHEERDGRDIFIATFIDLEKGVAFPRIYKQKHTEPPARFARSEDQKERWIDMQFQSGQSKAIRNAIRAGIPRWLQDAAMENAKHSALSAIDVAGLAESRQRATDFLARYGVDITSMEKFLGKSKKNWEAEDIARLRSAATEIKDGHASPQEIFGSTQKDIETKEVSFTSVKEVSEEEAAKERPIPVTSTKPEPPPQKEEKKEEEPQNGTRKRRTYEELTQDILGDMFGRDTEGVIDAIVNEIGKDNWSDVYKYARDNCETIKDWYYDSRKAVDTPVKEEQSSEPPEEKQTQPALTEEQRQKLNAYLFKITGGVLSKAEAILKNVSDDKYTRINQIDPQDYKIISDRLEIRLEELKNNGKE